MWADFMIVLWNGVVLVIPRLGLCLPAWGSEGWWPCRFLNHVYKELSMNEERTSDHIEVTCYMPPEISRSLTL